MPVEPIRLFERLLKAYGPQHWWPADGPFEVMVGAVLTQNTNWRNVERAIANLRAEGLLEPAALVRADADALRRLIRPAGFFRQKQGRLQRLARFVIEAGGIEALASEPTDRLRRRLLAQNGVGPETADSILLYAFDRPVFVVDAYTRRILHRLGMCASDIGYEALRSMLERALPRDARLFNEFHALFVAHAKRHCRTRPLCEGCPLAADCLAAQNARKELPGEAR